MTFKQLSIISFCLGFLTVFTSCEKNETEIPAEVSTFAGMTSGNYSITAPDVTYKIPVALTTVSDVDRTVTFTVTSPTGAVQGTHYTLTSNTITIPAGKVVDSIEVKGIFAQYSSGRKDTLIFTLQGDNHEASTFNNTFTLAMLGPCFEGDVDLNILKGAYKNTNEVWNGGPYGPYTTTITEVTQAPGAKTGTVTVANLFDNGWNPIKFNLDWTDPANRKVTLVQQSGIGNAGTISSSYAGQDISVRPDRTASNVGTFSICNQTLTLKLELGVTGLGFFNIRYTVNMAR